MPIKKPGQSKDSVHTNSMQGIDSVNDRAANQFIQKAAEKELEEVKPDRPGRKVKVAMMMRIDPDLLDRLDAKANSKGLSRSALISLACSEYLETH